MAGAERRHPERIPLHRPAIRCAHRVVLPPRPLLRPALGRFLSPDAYPYTLANPIELNRYVYAADNPVNRSDPSGLTALTDYSMANQQSEEESTAIEPVGKETAKQAQTVVEEFRSTQTWNTSRNARILRNNIKDGDILGRLANPGDRAHHIVPSTDPAAQPARSILDAVRIDINSKSNGLWLNPNTHYKTYPDAYVTAVNRILQRAYNAGGHDAVSIALRDIAEGILAGVFP